MIKKILESDFLKEGVYNVTSISLLILAVMGNFLANTLGCKTQLTLTNNMYIKNLILVFLIYFGVDATSKKRLHPAQIFLKSFLIWIMFIGFNRMRPLNTGIVAVLFVVLFVMKTYHDYLEERVDDEKVTLDEIKETLELVSLIQNGLVIGVFANVAIGAYMYWGDKVKEYGSNFDYMKFVMGVPKCKSEV